MKYLKTTNWILAVLLVGCLIYAAVAMRSESEKLNRKINVPRTWKLSSQK